MLGLNAFPLTLLLSDESDDIGEMFCGTSAASSSLLPKLVLLLLLLLLFLLLVSDSRASIEASKALSLVSPLVGMGRSAKVRGGEWRKREKVENKRG